MYLPGNSRERVLLMHGFYLCLLPGATQSTCKVMSISTGSESCMFFKSVLAKENIMRLENKVCHCFLHFRNDLLNECNNSDQT